MLNCTPEDCRHCQEQVCGGLEDIPMSTLDLDDELEQFLDYTGIEEIEYMLDNPIYVMSMLKQKLEEKRALEGIAEVFEVEPEDLEQEVEIHNFMEEERREREEG